MEVCLTLCVWNICVYDSPPNCWPCVTGTLISWVGVLNSDDAECDHWDSLTIWTSSENWATSGHLDSDRFSISPQSELSVTVTPSTNNFSFWTFITTSLFSAELVPLTAHKGKDSCEGSTKLLVFKSSVEDSSLSSGSRQIQELSDLKMGVPAAVCVDSVSSGWPSFFVVVEGQEVFALPNGSWAEVNLSEEAISLHASFSASWQDSICGRFLFNAWPG